MSIGVTAEIKSKIDIVTLIGESVALKKAGTTYKGLCPFHGERTPSFVVTPARESWHCFGCGLGGDVFSWVMQREGVDFPEALRRLAARAGVELDERTTREDARKKRLREVLESAISFYHHVLTGSRHGQPALDYLRGRGLRDETIAAFNLGWAPDSWEALSKALRTKRGVRDDELEAVGLAVRGRRQGVYDRFRGRIIFPIRDASGYPTGLGGRILPEGWGTARGPAGEGPSGELRTDGEGALPGGRAAAEDAGTRDPGLAGRPGGEASSVAGGAGGSNLSPAGQDAGGGSPAGQVAGGPGGRRGAPPREPSDRGPKYLNSPATPLFDKSRSLYLIDRAKSAMRRTKQAIIVEGYTDALMAHQEGFENVVASLGTALTPGQVELLTRYAPSIALAYDVDAAGQSAGTFGATELTALIAEIDRSGAAIGLTEVGVVRLPEGRDPDEVIRDDRATWEAAIREPQAILDYLIDYHATRNDTRTPAGRKRLVSAVLPVLRGIGNPTVRDYYVQRLGARSGVEDRVLRQELEMAGAGRSASGGTVVGAGTVRGSAAERGPVAGPRAEGEHAGAKISVEAVLSARDSAEDGGAEMLTPEEAARSTDPIERTLLRLLLRHPGEQLRIEHELPPEHLLTTPAREIWRLVLADRAADPSGEFDLRRFAKSLDPELAGIARAILSAREEPVPEGLVAQAVDQCLVRLERRHLVEHLDFVRAELAEAEARRDAEVRAELVERVRRLEEERADLDRRTAAMSVYGRPAAAGSARPSGVLS